MASIMLNQLQAEGWCAGLRDPQDEKGEKRKRNLHFKKKKKPHNYTLHKLPLQIASCPFFTPHLKGEEWYLKKYSFKILLHIKIFAKLFRIEEGERMKVNL